MTAQSLEEIRRDVLENTLKALERRYDHTDYSSQAFLRENIAIDLLVTIAIGLQDNNLKRWQQKIITLFLERTT
jgi:hypothetical protein